MAFKHDPDGGQIITLPTTDAERTKLRKRLEFGNKIRTLRKASGLTQPQLAAAVGVTKNAVTNWETGVSRPDLSTIAVLCQTLHCTANEFFGMPESTTLTEQEMKHMKLYRTLDHFDRDAVDELMASLSENAQKRLYEKCAEDFSPVPHVTKRFSAGLGNPLDDTGGEKDFMYLRNNRYVCRADAVVTVTGDSMLPSYHDGEDVLVERTETLYPGEIGLFALAGEGFIKEYQPDGLHSHNPKYKTIHPSEDDNVHCLGRVLGAVTDDMRPTESEAIILSEIYSQ